MAVQISAGMRYPRPPDTPFVVRESSPISPRPPKLLDRVREANRLRHGSRSTEKSYVGWIRRYILFHGKRHPAEMARLKSHAFSAPWPSKVGWPPRLRTRR